MPWPTASAGDNRLRALGLPKSLRQLALLTTGIQPRWLVLTTNALAFYMSRPCKTI